MVYVKWKIDYVPFVKGVWKESLRETLTGYRDIIIRRFLGENKDSFEFKLTNTNGEYNGKFNVNDKIYIYKGINTETTPTDPIMIGKVNDGTFGDDYSKDVITVRGYNFSESVMNANVFIDTPNQDIPTALQNALLSIQGYNPNFAVTWNTGNKVVQSDGGTFPSVNEQFFYKPFRHLIEKYSTNYATDDGAYYYYVDKDNTLVWKRGDDYTTGTFNATTQSYRSQKIGKDLNGIINFVIMKGGLDPKGHPIQTPFVYQRSVAKVGYKFKVIVSSNNSSKILLDKDMTKSYGSDKQATANNYPLEIENGTEFETAWVSGVPSTTTYVLKKSGISVTGGSTVTIDEGTASANKNAYVELIREETKKRLEIEAIRLTKDLQYGKLKYDVDFQPGEQTWGLGDRITVTNPKIKNGETTELRIKEIQDTQNNVKYSMEEDVGSVGN